MAEGRFPPSNAGYVFGGGGDKQSIIHVDRSDLPPEFAGEWTMTLTMESQMPDDMDPPLPYFSSYAAKVSTVYEATR